MGCRVSKLKTSCQKSGHTFRRYSGSDENIQCVVLLSCCCHVWMCLSFLLGHLGLSCGILVFVACRNSVVILLAFLCREVCVRSFAVGNDAMESHNLRKLLGSTFAIHKHVCSHVFPLCLNVSQILL